MAKQSKSTKIIISIIIIACTAWILYLTVESIVYDIKHPHDLFGGYYYRLDDLRADIDDDHKKSHKPMPLCYENYTYLFSKDFGDIIVDFVIREDQLAIVRIDCKGNGTTRKYRMLSTSCSPLDSIIESAEFNGGYDWDKVFPGLLSKSSSTQVQWCIVSESSGLCDGTYDSFTFQYNNETYYILYEIIEAEQ